MRRVTFSILCLSGAIACAAPAPAVSTRPAVASPVAEVVDSLSPPWSPSPGSSPVVQRIHLESELRSRIDSVTRMDSIRTTLTAEWSRVRGDGAVRLSGLVTAFGVAVDSAGLLAPSGLTLPLPFAALEGAGAAAPRVLRPDPAGCGPEAATAHILREAFLALPGRLEANTTWRDSASYSICRDSVPLTAISTRTFRVVRALRRDGALVVEIERRSALTLSGEGRQFGEPISIEATGDGAATLYVRLAGGVVVDGTGESTLKMTMRGRRRSQELTQRTRITISSP